MDGNELLRNIHPYRDQFYRFIKRNVWDSSAVDDVFSASVLTAWEKRETFEPGTNFRAWMFKIIVNKCFSANREKIRTEKLIEENWVELAEVQQAAGYGRLLENPEAAIEDFSEEVYQAFRKLSTAQRSCILLKDVEQFSYKEIAVALGIPAATVMTHLARGRAMLRNELMRHAQEKKVVVYPHLLERAQERSVRP